MPTAGQQISATIRLVRPLGEGGMGTVWVAHHLARNCEVAVKLIAVDEAAMGVLKARERFSREAEMAMRLRGPHIIQTFEHGVTNEGNPYLVMELLQGQSLQERIDQAGPLPLEDVARLVDQTAAALADAHAIGVIHRDIKPDNIFIEAGRPSLYVKVLDFGIAKDTAPSSGGSLTATGLMVGSPFFMAPEQMESAKTVGPSADIFSLGSVAYYALTGKLPFDGDTPVELWNAKKTQDMVKASHRVNTCPPALDAWFACALAPAAAERFSTPQQMAIAFSDAAGMAPPQASSRNIRSGTEPIADPEATAFPGQAPVANIRTHGGTAPLALDPGTPQQASGSQTVVGGPPAGLRAMGMTRPEAPANLSPGGGFTAAGGAGFTTPGGPASTTPGAPAGTPESGAATTAPGGPASTTPGGPAGTPQGGAATTAPGPASTTPGGPMSTTPGGPMVSPAATALPAGMPMAPPTLQSVTPSIARPPSRSGNPSGSAGKAIGIGLGGLMLLGAIGGGVYLATREPPPILARCKETQPEQCLDVANELLDDEKTAEAFRYLAVAVLRDGRLKEAHDKLDDIGVPKIDEGELTALGEACDEGKTLACYLHARMKESKFDSHAVTYLRERCDDHQDKEACAELGDVYDKGRWGVKVSPKEGAGYHKTACKRGSARGCVRLGRLTLNGLGGMKKDEVEGVEHFKKACKKKEMSGCVELGRAYARALGGLERDLKKAADLFDKACKADELSGCWELGVALSRARGRERDADKAVELFEKACEGGVMAACTEWGHQHERGQGGLERNVKKALELYQRACDAGDASGCVELGIAYEQAKGTLGKDEAKAVSLYKQACEAENMAGCRELANSHANGRGGLDRDPHRAFELYRSACEGGDLSACVSVGFYYSRGIGGAAQDDAKAREIWEKACDDGALTACSNLGAMYDHGEGGLSKDPKKAVELFQRGCDDGFGNLAACANLGVMYAQGRGGLTKDVGRAAEIYDKACNRGGLMACTNLGRLYHIGEPPIKRDRARATRIYEDACKYDYPTACSRLGYAYEMGYGVDKDEKRAVKLYERACETGSHEGCANLAYAHERGKGGLTRDRDRARALYRRACDAGNTWGCKQVKRMR